jgi:hypothetical protein
LKACWQAFDTAASAAEGKELHLGPRGGGRNLDGISRHTQEAEESYLRSLGVKLEKRGNIVQREELIQNRQTVLKALASAAGGEIPERGPRGGLHWSPRYFVGGLALLDHAGK